MLKGKGWFLESRRHKLASLGIKTGRKVLPKKIKLNVLEGNPMFFPQSKEILKIVELNYTATKLRMAGKEIDPIKLSSVARELEQKFREKGYAVNINTVGGKMTFHDIRLIPEVTGYNISPYTQKRGRVLNWDDWIKVNKIVNQQLDKEKISANVSSLGGKFVIREGTKAKTERDWSTLSLENVGSEVSPVARRDAWKREQGYPKGIKSYYENYPEYTKDSIGNIIKSIKSKGRLDQITFEHHIKPKHLGGLGLGIKKLDYTPKYKASDIGAVATDVVVGTGAEVKRYAPVIAVAKVRQWAKRKLKGRKKAKKKKSRKKGLFYPENNSIVDKAVKEFAKFEKTHTVFWGNIADVMDKHNIKTRKQAKEFMSKAELTSPKLRHYLYDRISLNYPQAIKEKYPSVVKEITKLSLKHNLKKPILKYGKNKRLATFIPPNTIKLSKKLVFKDRAKRKDVAQHEFKHLMDMKKTNIRDVAELERRAIQFEKVTK